MESINAQQYRRWYLFVGVMLALAGMIYVLKPILAPFVIGALIAYLGDPMADAIQRRGGNRTLASILVFTLIGVILVVTVVFTVPVLVQQLDALVHKVPQIYQWLTGVLMPWVLQLLDLPPQKFPALEVGAKLAQNWQSVGKLVASVARELTGSGVNFMLWLGNLVLIPVVAFYLLRDWDALIQRFLTLLPRDVQPGFSELARESDEVVGAFLRGQLIVMCALGAIYSTGLWLVGLELAILLGMIAGLASIVPYMGFVVGIVAASIAGVAQFQDWTVLIWIGLVFSFGQMIEGMVLTPNLVGDRIGLHPVAVIFAIMAGGQLAGFIGVLLALPVAAVIMVFLRHLNEYYRDSGLYGEN